MKYCTTTTEFNCGIDLLARQMHACVVERRGMILLHGKIGAAASGASPCAMVAPIPAGGPVRCRVGW